MAYSERTPYPQRANPVIRVIWYSTVLNPKLPVDGAGKPCKASAIKAVVWNRAREALAVTATTPHGLRTFVLNSARKMRFDTAAIIKY